MLPLTTEEVIPLKGGQLRYWPLLLDGDRAARLFRVLYRDTPWVQNHIRIAGKSMPIPRLNAWYGDSGAHYSYSGIDLETHPWTRTLSALKAEVETCTGIGFNSALLNLYRDGRDSVDWHSDAEAELGPSPLVASVSLGVTRRFELRHRTLPGERFKIELPSGSLLLMEGAIQHNWQHRVPKEKGVTAPRINITFRRVLTRPAR